MYNIFRTIGFTVTITTGIQLGWTLFHDGKAVAWSPTSILFLVAVMLIFVSFSGPHIQWKVKYFVKYRSFIYSQFTKKLKIVQKDILKKARGNEKQIELLIAFFDRYFQQEVVNIKNGFVITNFEVYSEFVTKLVKKAITLFEEEKEKCIVICTTLALSPFQWFNYNKPESLKESRVTKKILTTLDVDRLPIRYTSTTNIWQSYIESVEDLAAKARKREVELEIERYVLAGRRKKRLGLIESEDEIKKQLKSWISCDDKGNYARTFQVKEIIESLKRWQYPNNNLKKLVIQDYSFSPRDANAYFILPFQTGRFILDKTDLPSELTWKKVGAIFAENYHNHNSNALLSVFSEQCYESAFSKSSRNIPLDFFMIGAKKKTIKEKKGSEIDWLICLSGRELDEELHKLKLYFYTAISQPKEFSILTEFIERDLSNIQQIINIVEER